MSLDVLFDLRMPLDQRLKIYSRTFGSGEPLVTIIAGLHGDELDGPYLCHRLIGYFASLPPERFGGSVRLIPAANPLGLDVSSRFWPVSRNDINRAFPGDPEGGPTQRMADAIFRAARRGRYCIDIHSSNIFLQEIPQVRLSEEHFHVSAPMAPHFGLDVTWVNPSPTVIEATLAWNLSTIGIPTYVIETGIGLRIMRDDCRRVFRGIISFLHNARVLVGARDSELRVSPEPPRLARMDNVEFLNADVAGLFIPSIEIGGDVLKGSVIGSIIDPLSGETKSEVRAPASGYLFTLRAHPVVYEGSLLSRIIRAGEDGSVLRMNGGG
jgi:predicted deacylase